MNQTNKNLPAEQFYRTSALTWAALLMSQFIFLFVLFFIKPEVYKFDFSKPLLDENSTIILTLFAIAVVSVII